jgi:glycosyltransferase involved in cell wall biosynthesis
MNAMRDAKTAAMPRLLYVVTEDWYFLSHRLPMARAARDAGFDVHVATRLGGGRVAIEAEGFTPHPLAWRRGSLSAVDSLSSIRELRRLYRRLDPDIVHDVAMKPVLLGSAAALGYPRLAVVNSITGLGSVLIGEDFVRMPVRAAVKIALGRLLRRSHSCVIVQNPDDRDYIAALGVPPGRIALVPGSGVDTEYFLPLPEPPSPVTAAYVGRMLTDKGVGDLLEAYARLRRKGVEIELLLAGDCDRENPVSLDPQHLRERTAALGIHWLGQVEDIREVWARAHFAVLASKREGLPKSLLEAAACERSMVATDAPGCREIAVAEKTALTVPVGDIDALADAMARLAGDADLRCRFAAEARKRVENRFSADAIGRQTVALYASLLAGAASPASSA